jgi:Aminotransferase class I and II
VSDAVEPGQEVVICDPVYAGLVNRIRLVGSVPRFVTCTPGPSGWATDPDELAAAIGPRTAAVLLMSPVMPTGAVLGGEHPQHGPHRRRSIPAAVHPGPGRRHPDGWLGARRRPVPAPGLRQRTRRTAHRPARPLRRRTELTSPPGPWQAPCCGAVTPCRPLGARGRERQAVAGGRVTESSGGVRRYASTSTRANCPVHP